jgi:ankyrin repeat protein
MKLRYFYIALLGANTAFTMEPEPQPAVDLTHPSLTLLALPDELLMPILQDAIVTIIDKSTTIEKAMEEINKLASVNNRFDKLVHDKQMVAFMNKKLQPKIKEAKEWIKQKFDHLSLTTNANDIAKMAKLLRIPAIAKYITQEFIRKADDIPALIWAASQNHYQIVKMLLDAHADPNQQDHLGLTALMEAARSGHTQIVQILLDAHANPDLQSKKGYTALMLAIFNGHLDIARMLENYSKKQHK